jgi:hypothetical protein
MQNAFANMNIPHFLRFILLNLALTASLYALFIPFVLWHGNIFVKTGYRKIDLLLMFVPLAGNITFTRTQWRYCSKTYYWETAAPVTPVPVTVAA